MACQHSLTWLSSSSTAPPRAWPTGDATNSRQRAVNEVASCGFGFPCGPSDIRVVSLEYLAEQNGRSLLAADAAVQIIKCGDAPRPSSRPHIRPTTLRRRPQALQRLGVSRYAHSSRSRRNDRLQDFGPPHAATPASGLENGGELQRLEGSVLNRVLSVGMQAWLAWVVRNLVNRSIPPRAAGMRILETAKRLKRLRASRRVVGRMCGRDEGQCVAALYDLHRRVSREEAAAICSARYSRLTTRISLGPQGKPNPQLANSFTAR